MIVAKVDVVGAVPDRGPCRAEAAAVALGLLRAPMAAGAVDNLTHQIHVAQRLPLQGHLHARQEDCMKGSAVCLKCSEVGLFLSRQLTSTCR